MIRRLLQAIFAVSIVVLIAGCKPAKFVYVGGQEYSSNYASIPENLSGFDITASTGALTAITGSPWSDGQGGTEYDAVATSGQYVYETNANLNDIWGYSIDATTGALTPIPGNPFAVTPAAPPNGLAVSSSGQYLYASAFTSTSALNLVVYAFAIDSTTGALTSVAGSPFAAGTSCSPEEYNVDLLSTIATNGDFAYITNVCDKSVSGFAINTSTGALALVPGSPFPTGPGGPSGIAIDPLNGGFVYVTNIDADTISAFSINASTGALTSVPGSPFKTGHDPFGVAIAIKVQVDLDSVVDPIDVSSFAYVADYAADGVSGFSVDDTTGALTPIKGSPFKAGTSPEAIAADPAGHFIDVANSNSLNVSAYTIDNDGVLTPVAGSPFPVFDYPLAIVTTAGP
jgi:6-phosphogluconolactonase